MSNSQKISIILPVYNTLPYLKQCIESVINQSHRNIELVIIDDDSTDGSWEVIQSYAKVDKRIVCKRNERNSGVSYTANKAITLTTATYIARIDSDDYMEAHRLEKQLSYMLSNPDYVMIGSQVDLVDENGNFRHKMVYPKTHKDVCDTIFSFHPFATNSILVNTEMLPDNFRWYDPKLKIAEDLDMYFRLLPLGKVGNLPETLTITRERSGSLMRTNYAETFKAISAVRMRAITIYGIYPTLKQQIIMKIQWMAIQIVPTKILMPIFISLKTLLLKVN